MEKIAAHEEAADEAQEDGEAEREVERAADERREAAALLDVAADEQYRAVRQAQVIGAGAVVLEALERFDGV